MGILLGIAAVIGALGKLVHKVLVGRACLTWARRCDPANPSFGPLTWNAERRNDIVDLFTMHTKRFTSNVLEDRDFSRFH
ncbi:MAG: hypothetical protein QOJ91_277 [Sphingomonadales bacterium]|nr:hypothetical protein [Sphingomonadales bacterium]